MAPSEEKYIKELIEQYSDMVYRIALLRTRSKENSEDVLQEVFLKLTKKMPQFESRQHEKAWLIRVTINCTKNLLNSAWNRKTKELDDNIVFEDEEKNYIYYEVLKLPKDYRTIIHLYYYEGYKISEISKILKTKESTLKTRLVRAREKLKTLVEGGFEDE